MILLINGVAASGKTSIIHELQKQAPYPILKAGIDLFVGMMPHQYFGHGEKAHEGIQFLTEQTPQGPCTKVHNGPFGRAFLHSIPQIIQHFANCGFNIACDEVLFHDYYLTQYTKAFQGQKAYFIGIHCSEAELYRREARRKSGNQGLARDQINRVHGPTRFYDFEIDTSKHLPPECATQILDFIKNNPSPTGFQKLATAFGL